MRRPTPDRRPAGSKPDHGLEPGGRSGKGVDPSRNGAPGRGRMPFQPVDRSHLLRRPTAFPFPVPLRTEAVVRIRKERRVSGSFRGIPSLARADD